MAKVWLTGGTGYIGSHTFVDLLESGYEVFSTDNFSNSSPHVLENIRKISGKESINYEVDLCDRDALELIIRQEGQIDAVIHFAAYKAVGESVQEPLKYFDNNLNSLLNVLRMCKKYHIPHLVYSSSCTVYGNPEQLPVDENTPMAPATSPYGLTKQMGEDMIIHSLQATRIGAVLLRYFNPAGAHESGYIGEDPRNAALNLVPVITETAIGKREKMTVFGSDYPTRDGTCVRDYIHVMDLARAHTQALEYARQHLPPPGYDVFNLGVENGVTVLEAIQAFERASGQKLNYQLGPRRPGDVVAIYADATKAKEILGWTPQRDILNIMNTAWQWEKKRSIEQ